MLPSDHLLAADLPRNTSRRLVLGALVNAAAGFTAARAQGQMSPADASVNVADAGYSSPYSLRFVSPDTLLDAGFDQPPWNDPGAEAAQPFAAWQAANARRRGAAWGPPARQYPAPILPRTDAAYLRERVIGVAARHIGLAYQHHHVPSWAPPPGWPWLPVEALPDAPGLDCSNFISFVFNYALGIRLPTAIAVQGAATVLPGPGGAGCLQVRPVPLGGFPALGDALAPADLLYIRGRHGRIAHVVMWLGAVGQDPQGDHLIIDSSQTGHRDSSGASIPSGVRLRPFRRNGWYWRQVSHAHRILGAAAPSCTGEAPAFAEGGDLA
jgi:cell wall-associated NlpC family hydrolase